MDEQNYAGDKLQRVDYHRTKPTLRKRPIKLADNYEGAPPPEQDVDLADRLASLPEADRERIYQSLLDRATGIRLFVRAKRMGRNFQGFEIWRMVSKKSLENDGDLQELEEMEAKEWEGWVYVQPPSDQALQMVFAYAAGKPTQREQVQYDPVINVLHCIPGKRQWKRKNEDGEEMEVEEPEYGEYQNRSEATDENDYRRAPDDYDGEDEELVGYGAKERTEYDPKEDEADDLDLEEESEGEDIPAGTLFPYQAQARMIVMPPESEA